MHVTNKSLHSRREPNCIAVTVDRKDYRDRHYFIYTFVKRSLCLTELADTPSPSPSNNKLSPKPPHKQVLKKDRPFEFGPGHWRPSNPRQTPAQCCSGNKANSKQQTFSSSRRQPTGIQFSGFYRRGISVDSGRRKSKQAPRTPSAKELLDGLLRTV